MNGTPTVRFGKSVEVFRDGNILEPKVPICLTFPDGRKLVNFISAFRQTEEDGLSLYLSEPHEFIPMAESEPPTPQAA